MTEETDGAQNTGDDGLEVESASVSPFDPGAEGAVESAGTGDWPQNDHTVAKGAAAAPGKADDAVAGSGEADADADADAEAEAEAKTAADSTPKLTKRDKKAQRYNAAVREAREAREKLDATERRAADLERRLAALEQRPAPAAAKTDAAPARPAMPKLADFDTEEAFQTALGAWHDGELKAREDGLRTSLTEELDQRLTRERLERESRRQEDDFAERMRAVHEDHPDYDEKIAAATEVFEAITPKQSPFIFDLISNHPSGPELMYQMASNHDLAEALADLPLPTRPLRDAVISSPAADQIMAYFATEEGRETYDRLRRLRPTQGGPAGLIEVVAAVAREVGVLEAQVSAGHSGSARPAGRSVTGAPPPIRPLGGSPPARGSRTAGQEPDFDEWYKADKAREMAELRKTFGLPVS